MTELEKKTFDKVNNLIEKTMRIEEMASVLVGIKLKDQFIDGDGRTFTEKTLTLSNEISKGLCEELYGKGYRKASDVVDEIFKELGYKLHEKRGLLYSIDAEENTHLTLDEINEVLNAIKVKANCKENAK